MILIKSSLERPVRTSASTPRLRKISTAAGESWSAMRTLGVIGSLDALPPACGEGLGVGLRTRRRGVDTPLLDPPRQGGRAEGQAGDSSEARVAKAQSSQGVSARRSSLSTVAPHQ